LFAFASTTFILSWYNTGVRGITHPNVVVGMAVAGGGLAQLLAGMWEFPRGNCFAGSGQYEEITLSAVEAALPPDRPLPFGVFVKCDPMAARGASAQFLVISALAPALLECHAHVYS
jgi:hypothetical protein